VPAAPNVNQVVLVGQLYREPPLRELPDGKPVCDLRLAVNDHSDQPPMFIDVAAFGREAGTCAEHLRKGQQIAVVGRLVHREWQTPAGAKRSKHQVAARRIDFDAGGGKREHQEWRR
jgi:single-strand DNA-binding protein